jgi:hypothetical protein
VSRRLRLTYRFHRARNALGVKPGTPAALALAAEIRRLLAAESLPGPADRRALVPPTGSAYTRRVRGREVAFVGLTADPPVEADE